MTASRLSKVHFDTLPSPPPPAYSPPPTYAQHVFHAAAVPQDTMSFADLERIASVAEAKLGYLVTQKRREPSLRKVLLHATFLERVLDKIDATQPPSAEQDPDSEAMATDDRHDLPVAAVPLELHPSLETIVEVDEMEIDEEEEDEDGMPPLQRTVSHRPGSPVSSDDDSDDGDDSDDELPSPPPSYTPPPENHPLINLFEVREKARRDDLSNPHYHLQIHPQQHMFLMNNSLAVAA